MAAKERSVGRRTWPDNERAVGMAHPTVVPANFDPDESDAKRE